MQAGERLFEALELAEQEAKENEAYEEQKATLTSELDLEAAIVRLGLGRDGEVYE